MKIRILVLALLVLISVLSSHAGTIVLVGNFRSPSGGYLNGSIKFQLPFAGAVDTNCTNSTTGSCLVAPIVITFPISNGVLPATAFLTRNGDIQPANTYYRAFVYNAYGDLLSASNIVIPAGGSTFDVGAALQTTITTQNVSYIAPGSLTGNNTWSGINTFVSNPTLINFPVVGISMSPDGGGYKHKRVTGCATAASLNATCDTTVTWTTPFVDTLYTAVCTGNQIVSGVPIVQGINIVSGQLAGSITVRTLAITAAAAQFIGINCTASHD